MVKKLERRLSLTLLSMMEFPREVIEKMYSNLTLTKLEFAKVITNNGTK